MQQEEVWNSDDPWGIEKILNRILDSYDIKKAIVELMEHYKLKNHIGYYE